ncbi:MAG: type I DNA topoisomerase [bacterium]|nr:type I DNA topoisomerase [bacterium]
MKLVIVESPTKAKTIGKFLGKDFQVESSYGHVRDLPKSKIGIDVENNFEPHYIVPVKAKKRVNALKKIAAKADEVILATDEDREGEAIAWHLVEALDLKDKKEKIERIVFHEITKSAIEEALKNPRQIDLPMVDAQQARRVLDRLVGYLLSPFLWKKIVRGLSAGRVQSVALRLIVEREQEIKAFNPQEYWTIKAFLNKEKGSDEKVLESELVKINDENLEKLGIPDGVTAEKIKNDLEKAEFKIKSIENRKLKRNPLPPFITSTLQQAAFQKLRLSAKQTMRLAQGLYEKGFITYMRTDSTNLSQESLKNAQEWIKKNLPKEYLLPEFRIFKTKSRNAQEAHEAIRPSQPQLTPEELVTDQKAEQKLYELIWQRFMASQMPPADFESQRIEVETEKADSRYLLAATGSALVFDGFLKIWPMQFEEKELPVVAENEKMNLEKLAADQHFTEPPARYNEASLIKILEKNGIGRPSTYAPIISVIQDRNYVEKDDRRRFQPTEMGTLVNKVLTENFPQIVDIDFTAKMENELDDIAESKRKWQEIIGEFYGPFAKILKEKYETVDKDKLLPPEEKTDEKCDKCSKPMVIKTGRFGKFMACSGFPECKSTKSIIKAIADENGEAMICPKCNKGSVVPKRTKTRRMFYGCSAYPECDFASWKKPEKETTEKE